MTPPRTIRVGEVAYSVTADAKRWKDEAATVSDDFEDNGLGLTKHHDGLIALHPKLTPSAQRLTLLHECMHAAFFMDAGGPDIPAMLKRADAYDAEEAVIRIFAAPILGLLRNNPRLVAYLTEK